MLLLIALKFNCIINDYWGQELQFHMDCLQGKALAISHRQVSHYNPHLMRNQIPASTRFHTLKDEEQLLWLVSDRTSMVLKPQSNCYVMM